MGQFNTIYADGSVEITYSGGMIRIGLGNLEDSESNNLDTHTKIIMQVNGFLSMVKSCQELIDKMVDAGVIKEGEEKSGLVADKEGE